MPLKFAASATLITSLFIVAQAGAAGFEKGIMIGARSAGLAGIATPYTTGSEALYFNPAGLVVDKGMQDISLNVSPTMPKWKAPIAADNVQSNSDTKTVVPLGLMYARNINEMLAVGIGYYTSAGTYSSFKNVSGFPNGIKGTGEARTFLQINELALGVGYKITPNIKVGAAYRILMADASFKTFIPVNATGTAVANVNLNDLQATSYSGFKLGAQWKLNEMWDIGLTIRSNVPFKARGNVNGQVMSPLGDEAIAQNGISVSTTLPDAYQLGAEYKASATWHIFGEFDYISYSRVKNLQVSGTIAIPNVGSINDKSLQLGFKDQQQFKIAAEYSGFMMPIRYGYAWTSRVSDSQFAQPGLVPPGPANTLTLGTGYAINEMINLNGGVEYTWASGTGSPPAKLGKYEVKELAFHVGADYAF